MNLSNVKIIKAKDLPIEVLRMFSSTLNLEFAIQVRQGTDSMQLKDIVKMDLEFINGGELETTVNIDEFIKTLSEPTRLPAVKFVNGHFKIGLKASKEFVDSKWEVYTKFESTK